MKGGGGVGGGRGGVGWSLAERSPLSYFCISTHILKVVTMGEREQDRVREATLRSEPAKERKGARDGWLKKEFGIGGSALV